MRMKEAVALKSFQRIKEDLEDESLTSGYLDTIQKDEINLVKDIFGEESEHYKTINDAVKYSMGIQIEILLEETNSIIKDIEDQITVEAVDKTLITKSLANESTSNGKDKVFIVHGRDESTKEKTAQFLIGLGLEPIILHEQPNKGRTIIEKFEDHSSDVKYAVILLTSDDVGGLKSTSVKLSPRARQNVVFEMGHFFGRLGRGKVCALTYNEVERPSDIDGIVYISLDQNGGWKRLLARELRAAGLKIK